MPAQTELPKFKLVSIEKPWAVLECPRCKNPFKVIGKTWRAPLMSMFKEGLVIRGRACPYCLRTATVPAAMYPKGRRES